MQFRVVVPDKCGEGETIRIHISDGTEASVCIPSGLLPGDSFVCEVPTDQMKNPKALIKDQQQKSQQQSKLSKRQQRKQKNQAHPIAEVETRPKSDDSIRSTSASLVFDDNNSVDETEEVCTKAGTNPTLKKSTFLEREIIDCQDFVLALTVGLLVGWAIVMGFLVGIVHSTEAIYAVHPIEKPKVPKKQMPSNQRAPNAGTGNFKVESAVKI